MLQTIDETLQKRLKQRALRKLPVEQLEPRSVFADDRRMIATDLVKRYLRRRALKPLGAACVRKVFCDSYWQGTTLQDASYAVDGRCPLCRRAPDTLYHRLWACEAEAAATARAKASPSWFRRLARQVGANDPLFSHGWLVLPALPPPAGPDVAPTVWTANGEDIVLVGGALFLDVSCYSGRRGRL